MQKRLPSPVDSRTSQLTGTDVESKSISIQSDSTSGITRSLAKLIVQDNEIVILVIGNTGSGKSTLINYMLGCKMKSGDYDGYDIIDVEGKPYAEIGHSREDSQTEEITQYYLPDTNVSFCDYPGFGNTLHANVELRLETEKTRNAIIIVLSYADAQVSLRSTLENLRKLFHSTPDALSMPVLVAFTRIPDSTMNENRVSAWLSSGLKKLTDEFSIKLLSALKDIDNIICVNYLDNHSKDKINLWIKRMASQKSMIANSSPGEVKDEPKVAQPEKATEVHPTESSAMTHTPQVDSSARRMAMNMSSGVS